MLKHESPTVLVIGAGPSGLVALKCLREQGLRAECIDRGARVGGNWDIESPFSSIYESTHLISSKQMTQFACFPMKEDWPHYPSHTQALEYFQSFADQFDLRPLIHLNTNVDHIEKLDGIWRITFTSRDGQPVSREFDHIVIANGHHSVPLHPQLPGEFAGEIIHSHSYKRKEQLIGKRVLVVGGGNSGCDIAVEAAIHAKAAAISLRRGYHFLPKFIRGKPADVAGDRIRRLALPQFLHRKISEFVIDLTVGNPQKYGLPKPDHQLFRTHPIINSQLPYFAGHGRVQVYPSIERFEGGLAVFNDGRKEEFDLIVLATGYQVVFPFIDSKYLNVDDGLPQLHLHAMHPSDETIYVAGMIQPNSGQWGLVELQSELIARFLRARWQDRPKADWLRRQRDQGRLAMESSIQFIDSPRHRLEVDYFTYRRMLKKLIQRMSS